MSPNLINKLQTTKFWNTKILFRLSIPSIMEWNVNPLNMKMWPIFNAFRPLTQLVPSTNSSICNGSKYLRMRDNTLFQNQSRNNNEIIKPFHLRSSNMHMTPKTEVLLHQQCFSCSETNQDEKAIDNYQWKLRNIL